MVHVELPPPLVLARCTQSQEASGKDGASSGSSTHTGSEAWMEFVTDAPPMVWEIPAGTLGHMDTVSLGTVVSVVCATAALLAALLGRDGWQ